MALGGPLLVTNWEDILMGVVTLLGSTKILKSPLPCSWQEEEILNLDRMTGELALRLADGWHGAITRAKWNAGGAMEEQNDLVCGSIYANDQLMNSDCVVTTPLKWRCSQGSPWAHQTSHAWWPHCGHNLWHASQCPSFSLGRLQSTSQLQSLLFVWVLSHSSVLSYMPYVIWCHGSVLDLSSDALLPMLLLKNWCLWLFEELKPLIFWMMNLAQPWDYLDPFWHPSK